MSGRVWRAAGVVGGALGLLAGCALGTHSNVTATAPAASATAPPPVGSIEHPRPVECVDGLTFATGASTVTATPPGTNTGTGTSAGTNGGPGSGTSAGTDDGTSTGTDTGTDTGTGVITVPSSAAGGTPPPAASPTAPAKATAPATPSATVTLKARGTTPSAATPSGHRAAEPVRDVTVGPLTWRGLRAMATGDQSFYGTHNSDGWHYRIGPALLPGSTVTVTIGAQQRARAGLEYGGGYGTTPAPSVTFHSCPAATTTFPGGFFITGDGRACVPLDVRIGDGPPRRVVVSFFDGDCSA